MHALWIGRGIGDAHFIILQLTRLFAYSHMQYVYTIIIAIASPSAPVYVHINSKITECSNFIQQLVTRNQMHAW